MNAAPCLCSTGTKVKIFCSNARNFHYMFALLGDLHRIKISRRSTLISFDTTFALYNVNPVRKSRNEPLLKSSVRIESQYPTQFMVIRRVPAYLDAPCNLDRFPGALTCIIQSSKSNYKSRQECHRAVHRISTKILVTFFMRQSRGDHTATVCRHSASPLRNTNFHTRCVCRCADFLTFPCCLELALKL